MENLINENLIYIAFFGLIAFIVNLAAWSRGFFIFPQEDVPKSSISFAFVLIIFLTFLGTNVLLNPLLNTLIKYHPFLWMSSEMVNNVVWLATIIITLILLFSFCEWKYKTLFKEIWKNSSSSIARDLGIGAFTWILAFPLVGAISQLCDLLVLIFFGEQAYEQTAVEYLKKSMDSPLLLTIALSGIMVIAPLFEEFLFRGVLLTWFKKHLGPQVAILLSALLFACFHFSTAQKFGNISVVASLFILGCFLGFLYEKQRSLFAPIALHATFNGISTLRIMFFPDL